MKANVFIIHHARLGENLYWIPFVKTELEKIGKYNVIAPLFPDIHRQSFESWSKVLDQYKSMIDRNSIFVGYSTGAIFSIKYLIENNLKIGKFVSVAGFNNFSNATSSIELIKNIDKANETFFLKSVEDFLKLCDSRVSFYGDDDNFISQQALKSFAKSLKAKEIVFKSAGHFNKGTRFEKEFREILKEF